MTSIQPGGAPASNETQAADRGPVLDDWEVAFLIVALGIAGIAVVCALGGGDWFSDSALRAIGWIGALISLVGVIVAVLIFRRQTRDAEDASARQEEILGQIRSTLGEVHSTVRDLSEVNKALPDEVDTQEGEVDQWADATAEQQSSAIYATSPTGRVRRVYEPEQVPLAVLASLVSSWKRDGRQGKWTVGMLRGALRTEGKGNHPWFLIFEPREGESTAWRVSRGPHGSARAREIQSPRDLD